MKSPLIIPSETETEALHHQLAPSQEVFDLVFTHSKAVRDIALQLISAHHIQVDRDFVLAACLLHDVGAYELYETDSTVKPGHKYVEHGIVGAKLLKQLGYDEAFCRVAERHTGVGLTKEKVKKQGLPLPPKDYVPETKEERLIAYADTFHTKRQHFNTTKRYSDFLAKYDKDFPPIYAQMIYEFGEPDLRPIAQMYGQPILD
jgi:uncharacterized protein